MVNAKMEVYTEAPDYAPVDKRAVGEKIVDRCAFIELGEIADRIRGDVPRCDETPIMYIGTSTAKHYYTSHDVRDCPVDVLEWLDEHNVAVFENIEGGWSSWNGRPEFSETKIDYRNAQRVDIPSIIEERREGD
jgi:hypothetical protein